MPLSYAMTYCKNSKRVSSCPVYSRMIHEKLKTEKVKMILKVWMRLVPPPSPSVHYYLVPCSILLHDYRSHLHFPLYFCSD